MNFDNIDTQKNEVIKHAPITKYYQIKIFILCWAAYASAYFCRVNISIAIPSIQQSFGWSKTDLGLIGSSFFWAYGVGQLINGYIGDKISGRILIFIGLVVSALTNILFSFTSTVTVMVFLWAVNGYFQSMLWGPIIKILSKWFPKEQNTRISVGISTSMVGGFLLAWGFSGQILSNASWPWVFIIPGIIVLFYAFIWLMSMRKEPLKLTHEFSSSNNLEDDTKSLIDGDNSSFLEFIRRNKLWIIAIACVAQGTIKDGISLWGPSYLMETQDLDFSSTTGYILLIPIMNFGGILFSGWLNKKFRYNHKLAILVLFGASTLTIIGLFLFGQYSVAIGVALLGSCSALMYGANTLLLSVIPMEFSNSNKTSAIAGFLNFSCYMGAGISGVMTGAISDYWGWNGILIIWICMALIGIATLWKSWISDKKKDTLLLRSMARYIKDIFQRL